ncbi:MAG: hypothetical protein ACK47B_11780 [Armatimonadota bacterium]
MGKKTSNRGEHYKKVTESHGLQPESGKKGGEVSSQGHGPAAHKSEERKTDNGKSKRKKKSD